MSADPGENEAKGAIPALEDDPVAMRLGIVPHKPGVLLPGTPEHCHRCALDEIGRLRAGVVALTVSVEALRAENTALRAACVVAYEDADRLAKRLDKVTLGGTWVRGADDPERIIADLAAHVSAVASREVTTDAPREEGERCMDCGGTYGRTIWTAPDEMWQQLANTDGSGTLCPGCFDDRAKAQGMTLRWVPHAEHGNPTPGVGKPERLCWACGRDLNTTDGHGAC